MQINNIKGLIVVVITIIILLLTLNANFNLRKDNSNLTSALKISQDSTTHYKNKLGQTVAETAVMNLTVAQLKKDGELLGIQNSKLKDQIGNLNKLVTAYQANVSLKGVIETKGKDSIVYIKEGSSLVYKDFNYTTKYLSLKGYYNLANDSLVAKYIYSSPILISVYKQSNGFLRGFHYESKAQLDDPLARIDNQKVVVIDNNQKKFWNTTAFKMGVGFLGGYLITK